MPRFLSSCFSPCWNDSFNFMIVMFQENIIFDVKSLVVLVGSLVYNVQLWGLDSNSCGLNFKMKSTKESNCVNNLLLELKFKLWKKKIDQKE